MEANAPSPTIVLIGTDAALLGAVAASAGASNAGAVRVLAESVEQACKRPEIDTAAVVVVDIDPKRRESLVALQAIAMRSFGRAPVIVLADAFDDALVRWFLQIRLADFLRKPVEPKEILKACIRALKATSSLPEDGSQILSFLSPAGGVGTTTLAIEAAMLLRKSGQKDNSTRRLAGALVERLPDLKPRVIVNRFEQQLIFGNGLRRAEVERALEGYFEGTVVNNYKLVREAIDRGLPLEAVKAGSNVSTDLKRILLAQAADKMRAA